MALAAALTAQPSRPPKLQRTCRAQAFAPELSAAARAVEQLPYGRVYNFSAGPATLPLEVLEEAAADMLNWKGTGVSIMEMSHRSKEFEGIMDEAEAGLRILLNIPDNYKVLFMQGGASSQFAAIPLNLCPSEATPVDYIVTGRWSGMSAEEAAKYASVNIAAQGDFRSIPDRSTWQLTPGSRYLYYCANETVHGVEWQEPPQVGDHVLLVADMHSNFCSRPVDVAKHGVIVAGVQKNVGPSGATIVIVREDLLGSPRAITPTMLDFTVHAKERSLYNTPPTWIIYMFGLMMRHMLAEGGLPAIYERNKKKAALLYGAIDGSGGFYEGPVDPAVRSLMAAPFFIPGRPDLDKLFVREAEAQGLVQLNGHRSVGGMRASIYNPMSLEGVEALAAFMKEFQQRHG